MDTKNISQPLKQFLAAIPKTVRVQKVILFGSRNNKTARDDSDIDLVVVSDDFTEMDEDSRLDLLYHASRFIIPEIHPWGATKKELQSAHEFSTLWYAKTHSTSAI